MSNSYNFSDKDNGIIHVAYMRSDLSDDYNRHTGASMASVLEYCSKPVVFHIFHEEILSFKNRDAAEENMNKFRELADKYGAEVEFHNVVFPDGIEKCMKLDALSMFPKILLGRLYLPELLPNISKVVNLGSDIIAKMDLSDLLNIIPDDCGLAAAEDTWMLHVNHTNQNVFGVKYGDYAKSHSISSEMYVCTDMVVFNLDYIRYYSLLPDAALKYIGQYNDILLGDQDIINAVFHNYMNTLTQKYRIDVYVHDVPNLIESSQLDEVHGYILHYGGGYKPWSGYHSKYEMEYWYYLSLTPWGDNGEVFKIMQATFKTEDEIFENISTYIWSKSFAEKIRLFIHLSIGLYIDLIKRYWYQYIKK